MKIAFVTTLGLDGSTIIGRVLPLAEQLAKNHDVSVLVHKSNDKIPDSPATAGSRRGGEKFQILITGKDPFKRSPSGKRRATGLALIFRLKLNAFQTALKLVQLKPDTIIIVKPLPENVLAVALATLIIKPNQIILDVDDFELTANVLSSLTQRAAIHASERLGARLANHIITATPFLSDHFEQLTQGRKKITMIPTGVETPSSSLPDKGGLGWVLAYAGSLSLSSGHKVDMLPAILKEVHSQFPDVLLHIFGTGDDEDALKEKFAALNLTDAVHWHGRFNTLNLPSQLTNETILLDPIDSGISNRAKSSFRVTLAVLLGMPVVTSDIGLRPYLIPPTLHTRFFAKPSTTADYVNKIVDLIQNPITDEAKRTMRIHGQKFTWETLGLKYEKIIVT